MADRKVHSSVKLQTVVEQGSEVIDEIIIYRPKGKDMRVFLRIDKKNPESQEKAMVEFISSITAQPPSVLDALDYEDWQQVFMRAAEFAPAGPEAGTD